MKVTKVVEDAVKWLDMTPPERLQIAEREFQLSQVGEGVMKYEGDAAKLFAITQILNRRRGEAHAALLTHARNTMSDDTYSETQVNAVYFERNAVVAWAAKMAMSLGFHVVITRTAIEGWDPAWHNCIFIDTPEGQASWHFHDRDAPLFAGMLRGSIEWDGHTTEEKYARLNRAHYGDNHERFSRLVKYLNQREVYAHDIPEAVAHAQAIVAVMNGEDVQ